MKTGAEGTGGESWGQRDVGVGGCGRLFSHSAALSEAPRANTWNLCEPVQISPYPEVLPRSGSCLSYKALQKHPLQPKERTRQSRLGSSSSRLLLPSPKFLQTCVVLKHSFIVPEKAFHSHLPHQVSESTCQSQSV